MGICCGVEGRAERSIVRRVGRELMLPRRVRRRPDWSGGLGQLGWVWDGGGRWV